MKTKLILGLIALLSFAGRAQAQEQPGFFTPDELKHNGIESIVDDSYQMIYTDTVGTQRNETNVVRTNLEPYRVVTNKFGKNWFVFATAGAHSFRGDYSNDGSFDGTISPDFGVGVGKWFTPGVALKLEFIRSESRGYTEYLTGHYGVGNEIYQKPDGTPYRKMKTGWWDISGSVVLNLTRLFLGYEGIGNNRHMNQFMASFGLGGVHHLGYKHSYGSDNEWSGHIELQYSRFFTKSKRFSLDFKLRGLFYQTNFDLEYGQSNHQANKWDCNLGVDLGFTWYMGKRRANGWDDATTEYQLYDFRQQDVVTVYNADKGSGPVEYGALTFYVFYPNNYSGRNDGPQHDSNVNAIDYLAAGIFTQKQFNSNADVEQRLAAGVNVNTLKASDVPTQAANQVLPDYGVQRGYEMSATEPMTYPLTASALQDFKKQAGYYYAPIYDGQHTWNYRIDDATQGQVLLSADNYYETETFGLNSHAGIPVLQERMENNPNERLVSFADVYAALTSNEGYIADYTDQETVDYIRRILDSGVVTLIQAEGCATSQDNYTGQNATQVGLDRNNALAENRANTVVSWLKGDQTLSDISSIIYIGDPQHSIHIVKDPSTRGLNAKLNRCVRVKLYYMLP